MDRLKELLSSDQEKETGKGKKEKPEFTELEVYAFSVEEALKQASLELGTSIVNLEYEVLERGTAGFMGMGKKPSRILVKLSGNINFEERKTEDSMDIEFEAPSFQMNKDGRFKITVTKEGIFLRVYEPTGKGSKAEINDVIMQLHNREIVKYNENAIKQAVAEQTGNPVRIGDYLASPYDSQIQVQVSPDEMKAFVTFTKPEKYGRVPDADEVVMALKAKNVHYGIKQQSITDAIENEIYNMPVIVAEGDQVIEGKDAQINYHFRTEEGAVNFEVENDGSVDFHKLDNVQSVVVGQVLATKVPLVRGKPGKSLTGRVVPARDGKDIRMSTGLNTHISPDGSQIISDINGQVLFKNNRINVEPVFEVNGDVDLTTGDINFPGNIIIYGNVNDTFKVYSGANIEIKGNIGKAQVVAEGNIIVRQGIQGKDEAKIVTAGDLYARFIERCNVKAEGYVVVTDVILHSDIVSKKKVICAGGKRAQIAGGRVRSLYGINAKNLGAESYTETLLQTGIDPEAEDKMVDLRKTKEEMLKDLPQMTQEMLNLTDLLSQKVLPADKQERYAFLTMKTSEIKQKVAEIDIEMQKVAEYIESLGKGAKISASKTVFPGVKIKIKNDVLVVKNDYKFVTFFKDGANIKISPYEKEKEMEEKMKESGTARKDRYK